MLSRDYKWWDRIGCTDSQEMQSFRTYCKEHGITMGLISAVEFSITAETKIEWVDNHYHHRLTNYCVANFDAKRTMIETLIKKFNLEPDGVLFIDDYYSNLTSVAQIGVQAASPMEIVNWVNNRKKGR